MFVPCKIVDGVWVVLEEPFNDGQNDNYYSSVLQEYQEAKDRCIFEGFECKSDEAITNYDGCIIRLHDQKNYFSLFGKQIFTIECLVKSNLQLTKTAVNKIGI